MRAIKILLINLGVVVFSACTSVSICPVYPKLGVIKTNKILDLNDSIINGWMIRQYKLKKRLGICNETIS